jgi:hypothetical protein
MAQPPAAVKDLVRAEGHEHSVGPVSAEVARTTLVGLGWTVVSEASGHMHEVAIHERH